MAVVEAAEPRYTLRAGGLAATLLAAKGIALAERGVTLSLPAVPAYIWQDVLVALLFWTADRLFGRPRWMWVPYLALATYIVLNIPVVATLGSSLTPAMIRAAGGALGDSMQSALTPAVLAKMSVVAALAAISPRLLLGLPVSVRRWSVVGAIVAIATGAALTRSLDTNGLQRNAVTALLVTITPRIEEISAQKQDFRSSPFGAGEREDLEDYRGSAKGFNVLLVALESTAARYLAPYGAQDDPTPAFTALARKSIVFDAAYAAYPESIKGLFAVLSSQAPALDVPAESHASVLSDSVVERLRSGGYRTGLFHAGRFGYLGMQTILDMHPFDTTEDAGAIGGNRESSFGVDEPAVVSRMLAWIDQGPADRPFFLTYLPAAGHHPYDSTSDGPFPMDTALGVYKNAIHEGDRAMATLLEGLRTRGLADRTLVVIYGDHGEAFDQHPGNRAHSLYIYDENVRVPLVIHVPQQPVTAGLRVSRVASVVDIGPTILDLVGSRPLDISQGTSLLKPGELMALFHADYDRAWLGLRDGCWKYVLEVDAGRSRLFDLCSDPDEKHDVSMQQQTRVEAYRTRVEAWAADRRAAVLKAPERKK